MTHLPNNQPERGGRGVRLLRLGVQGLQAHSEVIRAIGCSWVRIASQSEVIRAIMFEDSPCCGVPHLQASLVLEEGVRELALLRRELPRQPSRLLPRGDPVLVLVRDFLLRQRFKEDCFKRRLF